MNLPHFGVNPTGLSGRHFEPSPWDGAIAQVLFGIMNSALACAIQWMLWPWIHPLRYILFYPAVMISAFTGGIYAGITTTVVSLLISDFFFLPPFHSFNIQKESIVASISFLVNCTLISGISYSLKKRTQVLESTMAQIVDAQKSLRESEWKFRTMFDALPQLAWMAHPDGFVFLYNQRWYEFTGTTPNEMEGWGWKSVHDPAILPNVLERWRLSLAEKLSFDMEFPLRGADGQFRWFLTRVVPFKDPQGNVIRWFGTSTDITELLNAEKELRVAKEAAESVAQVKARFLDIAAHELRTPVTAFSLLLQYVERELKKGHPVNVATMARLRGQADRLSRLVADLFDVARLEHETMTLRLEPTNLIDLISECLVNFRIQEPDRKFIFLEPKQAIEIDADPAKITQVLSNLFDNAVKYSDRTDLIEVKIESKQDAFRISVIDHGSGISSEEQKVLFEPLGRGTSNKVEQTSGLGLGLFISRSIIGLHGGTMGVESKVGVGSTFYFELPDRGASRKAA